MKIIRTNNYDKDDYNEKLIFIGSDDKHLMRQIAELMNQVTPSEGPDYYKVVENDYVLKKFEP